MALRELLLPWDAQPQEPVKFQFSPAHVWALNVGGSRSILDLSATAHGVFGAGTGGTTGNAWVNTPEGWCVVFSDSGTGVTTSKALAIGNASGSGAPSGNVFSLIGRIRLAALSSTQAIYAGGPGSVSFRVAADNKLELLNAGYASIGKSSSTLSADVDYDVGVSYDGTVASFFINGVEAGTASSAQTFSHTTQYWLGSYAGTAELVGNGFRLYRFAVFNKVMPADFFLRHAGSDFWALAEPQNILVPGPSAAGSTTYTLSAPTYVPGSITSTGLTARVMVTAA